MKASFDFNNLEHAIKILKLYTFDTSGKTPKDIADMTIAEGIQREIDTVATSLQVAVSQLRKLADEDE